MRYYELGLDERLSGIFVGSTVNRDELKDDEGLGLDDASEEDESENVFRVYDARFKLPAGTTGGSSKDPPTF